MWEDPIVSEVARIRDELASRFNYDVAAIFADIRKKQSGLGAKLVHRGRTAGTASDRGPQELRPGR